MGTNGETSGSADETVNESDIGMTSAAATFYLFELVSNVLESSVKEMGKKEKQ